MNPTLNSEGLGGQMGRSGKQNTVLHFRDRSLRGSGHNLATKNRARSVSHHNVAFINTTRKCDVVRGRERSGGIQREQRDTGWTCIVRMRLRKQVQGAPITDDS